MTVSGTHSGKAPPKVLIVEDSPSSAELYAEILGGENYQVVKAETGAQALAAIAKHIPEAVLLDLHLPDMDGIEILRHVRAQSVPSAVVVITAHGSVNVAVDAMRSGAYDFLVKPFNAERLLVTLRNAIERQRLSDMVDTLRDDIGQGAFHGFIGRSLGMQAVYRVIDAAAGSKATVFITGESGTGKEVCAEALHKKSPRAGAPFVALNCAAVPKDLMESEIFGHVKGAFTGATADREGAAARANGGTLFLDEICEMDLALQSKLLRFIQTGSFQPVGGNQVKKVDIRFVCATNRDPLAEVAAGRFREDLYYRLHVIPINLPPLRERDADVLEIAESFLRSFSQEEGKAFQGFEEEARSVILAYDWPGNVRQLQNVLRNVVVLHDGDSVTLGMLPPPLGGMAAPRPALQSAQTPNCADEKPAGLRPLWQIERDAIEQAIALCNGNIPRAAALLEVAPSTIYRKKQAWEAGVTSA